MQAKSIFALSVAIAASLCSCKKEEVPAPTNGVQMTLTASISDPSSTKLISNFGASEINFAWEENAKVSIITLERKYVFPSDYYYLRTNDVFTADNAAGAATATFSGTFTGDSKHLILCYYPALTEFRANEYSSANNVIKSAEIGDYSASYALPSTVDPATDYIGNAAILSGAVSMSGSELSTNLIHRTSVIKVKADLSGTELASVDNIEIKSSVKGSFYYDDWFEYSFGHRPGVSYDTLPRPIRGGNPKTSRSVAFSPAIAVDKAAPFVSYIHTAIADKTFNSGDTWTIYIQGVDASNNPIKYSATKTFTSTTDLFPGHCYTINIPAAELSLVLAE